MFIYKSIAANATIIKQYHVDTKIQHKVNKRERKENKRAEQKGQHERMSAHWTPLNLWSNLVKAKEMYVKIRRAIVAQKSI